MTTIRDVARRAGVAPITVSRTLNNSGYVSPATRPRVEQAATELNFVPNMLAHSLRSNRTNTLALVLTDITNPFWTAVARGVEDVASDQGFNVIFCNTDERPDKQEQYLTMLLRRRVDGVLLVPATSSGDAVRTLLAQQVNVVVLDRRVDGVAVDVVRGDSFRGAYDLSCHLLGLGHRAIALLGGPAEISVSQERLAGYRRALAGESGMTPDDRLIHFGQFSADSGYAMTRALLAAQPRPTAIFAANNFIAVGAQRALHAAQLAVPNDVSLVAFDNLPYPYTDAPTLTVAAQPTYELGVIATRRLLERIGDPSIQTTTEIVLPTTLHIRTSTRAPA